MAARIIRKILKRIKRTLYNNERERKKYRMSYIYDPEGILGQEYEYLTIGSLVYYGSVTNAGNNRRVGIIIDAKYSNIVSGEVLFSIYSEGSIIETIMVYPVGEVKS